MWLLRPQLPTTLKDMHIYAQNGTRHSFSPRAASRRSEMVENLLGVFQGDFCPLGVALGPVRHGEFIRGVRDEVGVVEELLLVRDDPQKIRFCFTHAVQVAQTHAPQEEQEAQVVHVKTPTAI